MANIKSNNITIYPAANRNKIFDYTADLTTEQNITKYLNSFTDYNNYIVSMLSSQSIVSKWKSNAHVEVTIPTMQFIINGYILKFNQAKIYSFDKSEENSNLSNSKNYYLYLNLNVIDYTKNNITISEVGSFEDSTNRYLDQKFEALNDNIDYYTGLKIILCENLIVENLQNFLYLGVVCPSDTVGDNAPDSFSINPYIFNKFNVNNTNITLNNTSGIINNEVDYSNILINPDLSLNSNNQPTYQVTAGSGAVNTVDGWSMNGGTYTVSTKTWSNATQWNGFVQRDRFNLDYYRGKTVILTVHVTAVSGTYAVLFFDGKNNRSSYFSSPGVYSYTYTVPENTTDLRAGILYGGSSSTNSISFDYFYMQLAVDEHLNLLSNSDFSLNSNGQDIYGDASNTTIEYPTTQISVNSWKFGRNYNGTFDTSTKLLSTNSKGTYANLSQILTINPVTLINKTLTFSAILNSIVGRIQLIIGYTRGNKSKAIGTYGFSSSGLATANITIPDSLTGTLVPDEGPAYLLPSDTLYVIISANGGNNYSGIIYNCKLEIGNTSTLQNLNLLGSNNFSNINSWTLTTNSDPNSGYLLNENNSVSFYNSGTQNGYFVYYLNPTALNMWGKKYIMSCEFDDGTILYNSANFPSSYQGSGTNGYSSAYKNINLRGFIYSATSFGFTLDIKSNAGGTVKYVKLEEGCVNTPFFEKKQYLTDKFINSDNFILDDGDIRGI